MPRERRLPDPRSESRRSRRDQRSEGRVTHLVFASRACAGVSETLVVQEVGVVCSTKEARDWFGALHFERLICGLDIEFGLTTTVCQSLQEFKPNLKVFISFPEHSRTIPSSSLSARLPGRCCFSGLREERYEETIFGNPYEDEPPRDLQQTIAKAPRWANLMGPYLLDSFRTLVLVHCELFGLRKMLLDLVIDSRETLVPFFCI